MRANAMALEQSGDSAGAEQIWQKITASDPRSAEAFAHLGLLEARQNRLKDAIDHYRQAAAIDPDLPGLQMNLGLALFKAAQFPDAIRVFSAEIGKHPGDQRLTILLGMSHYGLKDYFVAIPYLQRAAERDPQNLTLRMALARSCLLSEQYECVIAVHREIQHLGPEIPDVDVMAAEALDAMRDTEGAVKQLRAALEANPEEPNAHFALGYIRWTKSEWAEAAREFQEELQHNPQNVRARIYLADAQVRQNDFTQPLGDLDKLVQKNSLEPLMHLDFGIIAAKKGRTDDALRELAAAAEQDDQSSELHLRIANVYESLGQSEEASKEREKARRLERQSPPDLLEMIDLYESSS